MAKQYSDPVELVIMKARELGYSQGFMDGISYVTDERERERLRKLLVGSGHVCYYSVIGPYCVVCRKSLP